MCVFVKWHKNNADIFGHKHTCIQKLTSIAKFRCDSLDASFISDKKKQKKQRTKMNNDDGLNFKKSPQKYPMLFWKQQRTHSGTVCSKYRRYIYTHSSTRFDSAKRSTIILNCHRVMAHMLCFVCVSVCVCWLFSICCVCIALPIHTCQNQWMWIYNKIFCFGCSRCCVIIHILLFFVVLLFPLAVFLVALRTFCIRNGPFQWKKHDEFIFIADFIVLIKCKQIQWESIMLTWNSVLHAF